VYGGVDLERFSPNLAMPRERRRQIWLHAIGDPLETSRVILALGQATAAKGHLDLLDAWQQIGRSSDGWQLAIGGGTGELDMSAEIAQRGLRHNAHWIGPRTPDEIPELLRASDAFVLASHNEGLSLSVLEALSTGLPTIATRVGGHSEVISSASEGWLIPPRDISALAEALVELLSSFGERSRRGQGGRQAAERIGSPASNAQKLKAILERCVKVGAQTALRARRA
jgi:glycosyltransferase involved in cell wall biosynthesis